MAVLADAPPCGPIAGWTFGAWSCRGVQRGVAIVSARRCHRRECPQRRGAYGCRCPPGGSTVRASGPPMSAGRADLAHNPSRCPRSRTPRPCPRCGWVLAGRPLSTRGGAAAPEQGGDTAAAGSRPSRHTRRLRQWAPAACGHCQGVQRGSGTAAPGDAVRTAGDGRTAGVRSTAELDAASVRCPPLLSTAGVQTGPLPQSAGVRGYRNRSSGPRPLEGCCHRWYTRASWRCSRSPSRART
jgi:hypothetical protein